MRVNTLTASLLNVCRLDKQEGAAGDVTQAYCLPPRNQSCCV